MKMTAKYCVDIYLECDKKGKCNSCLVYNEMNFKKYFLEAYPDKVINYDLCKTLKCDLETYDIKKMLGKIVEKAKDGKLTKEQEEKYNEILDKITQFCSNCILGKNM